MIEAKFEWGGDEVMGDLRQQLADRLLRMGVLLQTTQKTRMSVPNPAPHKNPSKPGQYPKLRTGFARGATTLQPSAPEDVKRTLTIRVGFLSNAFYAAVLELLRGRLGLRRTLDDLRGRLQVIAEKG